MVGYMVCCDKVLQGKKVSELQAGSQESLQGGKALNGIKPSHLRKCTVHKMSSLLDP